MWGDLFRQVGGVGQLTGVAVRCAILKRDATSSNALFVVFDFLWPRPAPGVPPAPWLGVPMWGDLFRQVGGVGQLTGVAVRCAILKRDATSYLL